MKQGRLAIPSFVTIAGVFAFTGAFLELLRFLAGQSRSDIPGVTSPNHANFPPLAPQSGNRLPDRLGTVRCTHRVPEFWFAMQLAMLAGFVTSYPVNWLLIRIGWKERM